MRGQVRASPKTPSAPPIAVLNEWQQLAPGHEEAAEAPQDTLQVSLQHARGLQCNSLHLQAPQVPHGDMNNVHAYGL